MTRTENPVEVTWTVDGVKHNRVIQLSTAEPKVVCGYDCCCKQKAG
jgi:hypothetical protein